MRRLFVALPLLAIATPAIAADAPADPGLDRMAKTLADPERQQALARAMGAMTDVLLDIPLAPILGPLAEAAGEDPRSVDRDATLRKMAPGAGTVSRQVERAMPKAMGAMAGMSTVFADLLPQLREAADRMRDALPTELAANDLADLPYRAD